MHIPRQVYSKEQLLGLVGANNIYLEDHTIDVHISRLQKTFLKVYFGQ